METENTSYLSNKAKSISRFKKSTFLMSMSEDEFRDSVIRPLFYRQGLKDGRDLCGPVEEGKDTIFSTVDNLGLIDLYAVQTKKGNLNLTAKINANLIAAITQVQTALATPYHFIKEKQRKYPAKVLLCTSGKINDHARKHIVEEVKDPRVIFYDSDDLIPLIDQHYPEFWLGIEAELTPYFRAIIKSIEGDDDTLSISEALPASAPSQLNFSHSPKRP